MESRFTRMEVVGSDDSAHTVDLRILSYGTVDSFGTVWEPGCVDDTLRSGYLPLAFSHSWDEPVGHMVERLPDDGVGPVVRFQFDNFEDVPRARQVYSQMRSGTLRDCSIGFNEWTRRDPTESERSALKGARDVVSRVGLDEVSVVLHGAVQQAELVGIRSLSALAGDIDDRTDDIEVDDLTDEGPLEANADGELVSVVDYTEAERLIDQALYNIGS